TPPSNWSGQRSGHRGSRGGRTGPRGTGSAQRRRRGGATRRMVVAADRRRERLGEQGDGDGVAGRIAAGAGSGLGGLGAQVRGGGRALPAVEQGRLVVQGDGEPGLGPAVRGRAAALGGGE